MKKQVGAAFASFALSLLVLPGSFAQPLPCYSLPVRTELPMSDSLPVVVDEECKAVSGEFGILDKQSKFTATAVVPFKIGQTYGWRIKVEPENSLVHWKEEFVLPGVPKTWGGHDGAHKLTPEDTSWQEVQPGGKTCVTERDSTAIGGVIFNYWSVATGDPRGKYQIRVFIEGKLFKTFSFQVKSAQ